MTNFAWLPAFKAHLEREHLLIRGESGTCLAPARCLEIDPEDWAKGGAEAARFGLRWAGLWADRDALGERCTCVLENAGDYLILSTRPDGEALASHSPWYPAAGRLERHARDLFGLRFEGLDERRWTRHQAWPEDRHPLVDALPAPGETPPDGDYPFAHIPGEGVYEIPVGPVHAGIIEPGHFRFNAVGETILGLEERLGYVHKGIEHLARGRDPAGLARLAGRVSGDSTVAHAWAACQAMERAAGLTPPARAVWLRALFAERERVANHLGDIGAICNDVGFAFAQYQFQRLREVWTRRNADLCGHRLLMDQIVPGGVACEPEALAALEYDHRHLRKALAGLFDILEDHPSLRDRLQGTGRLSPLTAAELGVTGYVGKASDQAFDLRRDDPYPPFDRYPPDVPRYQAGDVAARMRVRMDEIGISLDLMDRLLGDLPKGDLAVPFTTPEEGEGLGCIEGWRGEILSHVRFAHGRVARFFPRDPSWFTWPALEHIVQDNIVPDFPVCNKSVNASYSGVDL